MLYKMGRLLQFLGLLILPAAIAGEVSGRLTLQVSLTVSGVGMGIFFLGWLLQQSARPR